MKIEELKQAVKILIDNCSKHDSVCMGCPFMWIGSREKHYCMFGDVMPEEWRLPDGWDLWGKEQKS